MASVEVASAERWVSAFHVGHSLQDHARFKALCALHSTTMRNEIQAIVGAQLAAPDVLVSALLTQPEDAAQARGIPIEKLVTEVLGQLAKKAGGPKLARSA